jgi:hypothetical protein
MCTTYPIAILLLVQLLAEVPVASAQIFGNLFSPPEPFEFST